MPYIVGIVLSVGVALLARSVGFDRDRAFYATVIIVVASYYVLFAVMSQSMHTVLLESVVMTAFVIAAIAGSNRARGSLPQHSPAMASSMPFMATLSKTLECRRGGPRSVGPTT